MAAAAQDAGCLMDEFLPECDFRAAYEVSINAPAAVVYQKLLGTDFNAAWIVRFLLTLRTGKRVPRRRASGGLRQKFQGSGFVILAEAPGEELVIGVAGKFWRPDGGRCLNLKAGDFVRFSRPGCAKVAMNFRLRPESPHRTVLSTETRIQCCDRAAWWKFRLYWTPVGPFSGVIRMAILKRVKEEAETAVRRALDGRIA